MSLSVTIGAKSLISLGVTLSDVAMLYNLGRKFGNFLCASKNEDELLESIMEQQDAILKRRGLADGIDMENKWETSDSCTTDTWLANENTPSVTSEQELSAMSWLMVPIVAGLDLCLPSTGVIELALLVFLTALGGDERFRPPFRIQLPTLIESWRSLASVRSA